MITWLATFGCMTSALILPWLIAGKAIPLGESLALDLFVTTVLTTVFVWAGVWTATRQLGTTDGRSLPIASMTTPASSAADAATEPVRLQVQGPAIGLLVTGILNWLAVPLIVVVMAHMTGAFSGPAVFSPDVFVPGLISLLASLLFSSFVIFAALKMKQLEAYGLAITASILAILISPSNLIGLPIGIWSLVVLSRAEVQAAFARQERKKAPRRPATLAEKRLGIAALVLAIAAVPVAFWVGVSVERGGAKIAFVSFALLEMIALICGIAGRAAP